MSPDERSEDANTTNAPSLSAPPDAVAAAAPHEGGEGAAEAAVPADRSVRFPPTVDCIQAGCMEARVHSLAEEIGWMELTRPVVDAAKTWHGMRFAVAAGDPYGPSWLDEAEEKLQAAVESLERGEAAPSETLSPAAPLAGPADPADNYDHQHYLFHLDGHVSEKVATEREACAQIADEWRCDGHEDDCGCALCGVARGIAKDIRSASRATPPETKTSRAVADPEALRGALRELIAAVDWSLECLSDVVVLKSDRTNIVAVNERARAALSGDLGGTRTPDEGA